VAAVNFQHRLGIAPSHQQRAVRPQSGRANITKKQASFASLGAVAPVSLSPYFWGGRLHNKAVNTDAQGRPLAALAPILGRGLLPR
jgi:hypothetical protein